jgi:hypothetical protein
VRSSSLNEGGDKAVEMRLAPTMEISPRPSRISSTGTQRPPRRTHAVDVSGHRRSATWPEKTVYKSRTPFSTKAKQYALLGPVSRQMCGQSHECLGIELWRLPTVDDRSGDIRCEPGEAEQSVDVSGRDPLLARDVVHGEVRVLGEAPLNVVSPRDNSQEAHVDRSSVTGIIDQHFHFAAGALELCRRRQGYDIIGRMGWPSIFDGQIKRWCGEDLNQVASADVDFDAIGRDLDAADQGLEDRLDRL